jgi:hypothetical protein
MASLTSDLRAWLLDDAGIYAQTGTRIRPRKLAQDETYPAIRITRAGGLAEEHLDGPSELRQATIQIDCYATTSEAADALLDLVYARLASANRQTAGETFFNAVRPQGDMRQTEEPRGDGNDSYDYISSQDFAVSYTR